MTIGSRYKILDPVCDPEPEGATLAPRLDTLEGKVVGLYSNRVHATKLLDLVSVILSERFNLQDCWVSAVLDSSGSERLG